ncbi:MAG: hypothetical protein WBW98_10765 [Candidatus Sulfotelmatobacter sp.]
MKDRNSGAVVFDEVLRHGALVSMLPFKQWAVTHEMPAHYEPCGPRFALVFRYVTKGQQTALKCDAEGRAEWAAANLNATGAHAGK